MGTLYSLPKKNEEKPEEELPRSFWIKYWLLEVFVWVSPFVVAIGCYESVYINYPFIMTHPREDAATAVAFFCYVTWKYAISPNKEKE